MKEMSQAARNEAGASAHKRYEILASLAKGGMGEVLVARERAGDIFSRLVVLKAPLRHLCEEEEFLTSFLDEARLTAQLRHPNIAQVHDVVDLDGRPCMVMEYLTGYDLNQILRRAAKDAREIPIEVAVAVIHDIAAALAYAHGANDHLGRALGVVHRDISPHNVFLTRDGMVKLIDFGVARSAARSSKTATGVLKGKLAYMAPESLRARPTDARADIWALGVVAWELLTHQRLFRKEDADTVGLVLSREIPSLTEMRPEIDPELDAIVSQMLRREPDARTTSATEVVEALGAYSARRSVAGALDLSRWLAGIIPPSEDEDYARRGVSKTIALTPMLERDGIEDHPTDPPPAAPDTSSATVSVGAPPRTVSMEAPEATAEETAKTTPAKWDAPAGPVATPASRIDAAGPAVAPPEPSAGGSKMIVMGAAVFLALSGLAGAALVIAFSPGEEESVAEPVVVEEATPTPAPESIVRVDGAPNGARVMIDGERAASGQARVPRDGRLHHVAVLGAEDEVLLERHVPVERDVTIYYAEARPPEIAEERPGSEMRPASMRSHPMMRPSATAGSMTPSPSMMSAQVGEGELLTNF